MFGQGAADILLNNRDCRDFWGLAVTRQVCETPNVGRPQTTSGLFAPHAVWLDRRRMALRNRGDMARTEDNDLGFEMSHLNSAGRSRRMKRKPHKLARQLCKTFTIDTWRLTVDIRTILRGLP